MGEAAKKRERRVKRRAGSGGGGAADAILTEHSDAITELGRSSTITGTTAATASSSTKRSETSTSSKRRSSKRRSSKRRSSKRRSSKRRSKRTEEKAEPKEPVDVENDGGGVDEGLLSRATQSDSDAGGFDMAGVPGMGVEKDDFDFAFGGDDSNSDNDDDLKQVNFSDMSPMERHMTMRYEPHVPGTPAGSMIAVLKEGSPAHVAENSYKQEPTLQAHNSIAEGFDDWSKGLAFKKQTIWLRVHKATNWLNPDTRLKELQYFAMCMCVISYKGRVVHSITWKSPRSYKHFRALRKFILSQPLCKEARRLMPKLPDEIPRRHADCEHIQKEARDAMHAWLEGTCEALRVDEETCRQVREGGLRRALRAPLLWNRKQITTTPEFQKFFRLDKHAPE
jgi:hypothetical protein